MTNEENDTNLGDAVVDACPKNRVNEDALFQKVEVERDRVYSILYAILAEQGIKGEVTKSAPYEYTTQILIRLWHHDESKGTQYRGEATITVTPHPSKRYPLTLEIKANSGGRKRTIKRVIDFNRFSAGALITFLSSPTSKLKRSAFKRHGLIFNKNKLIKRPGVGYLLLAGLMPTFAIGSIFIMALQPIVGIATFLISSSIFIIFVRRKERVHNNGVPPQNPRNLVRMDSWQSVIIELGDYSEQVKNQVKHELIDGKHEEAVIDEEEVSYLSTQGKSVRNQVVVNFRRAIAFVEIHQYGTDLYVDWEAYLNLGVWKEVPAGVGYDSDNKCKVKYMEVERAIEGVNEYDISDANFLIEWVHACLTRVVRQLKKELSIDQEFDFTIQRSDRRAVLHEGEQKAKSGGRKFKRSA